MVTQLWKCYVHFSITFALAIEENGMQPFKLIVVGPVGAGKTTIANYIADATEIPFDYRPTKGVRILEFEVPNVKVKNKTTKVDVELWDCSGGRQYENCWPALRKDAQGVIFVYGKKTDENISQLERLYDYFVNQPKLEPKSCVVFHYDPEKTRGVESQKNIISPTFARISQVTCNTEEGGARLKMDFHAFLGTLTTRKQEKSEQEENNIIISDSGTFAMR